MLLDTPERFAALDPQAMLSHIHALPDQVENAWALAHTLPLPEEYLHTRLIVLSGMGGSAIGGDYLAALVAHASPVPILVVRGYDLPAYVAGSDVLLIASSNSGNTEETLAAYEEAGRRGVKRLAITTGGTLAARAAADGVPLWQFTYRRQPRAALGWSLGLLIGLADRLGLAAGKPQGALVRPARQKCRRLGFYHQPPFCHRVDGLPLFAPLHAGQTGTRPRGI